MHFEKLGKSLAYHLLPGKGSLLQTKSNTVLEHITTIHYWQWYRVEVETKGWKSEIQSIIKAVLIFDVLQFYINIWKISKKQNQLVNTRPGVGQCLGLPWQSSTGTPQLFLIPFASSTEIRQQHSHSSHVGTRGAVWFLFRSFFCQRWVLGWWWQKKIR